ncbi:MAG: hypothetical protein HOC60_00705, partial [Rhodospirillaceae bacterium]|nr:hypothetical protein [Rhodospirillaceae bacterium]
MEAARADGATDEEIALAEAAYNAAIAAGASPEDALHAAEAAVGVTDDFDDGGGFGD